MKFSVYGIAALAATSSSCVVWATASVASRKRKIQKKTSSGATGSSGPGQPGATCKKTSDCAIPPGLDHAVCRDGQC